MRVNDSSKQRHCGNTMDPGCGMAELDNEVLN